MSKIIVGVDESDRSRDAVALAAMLARGGDAELVLVCAYPYDDVPGRGAHTGYRQYLREDAEAAMGRATAGMGELPHTRRLLTAELSPAKAIQNVAAQESASLIVIGSSGRGGAGRVFAGTTAERLLHGAPCPVAVAPRGFQDVKPGDIGTIVVGYDGSVEAKAALVGARSIARVRARDCVWSRSSTPRDGHAGAMQGPGYILTPGDAEARARDYLTKTASTLAPDVPTDPVVAVGAPEQVLADESKSPIWSSWARADTARTGRSCSGACPAASCVIFRGCSGPRGVERRSRSSSAPRPGNTPPKGPMPRPDPAPDVLVAFASRHGATRGVAKRIAARLHESGLAVVLHQVEDVGELPPIARSFSAARCTHEPATRVPGLRRAPRAVARATARVAVQRGTFGDRRRVTALLMRARSRAASSRSAGRFARASTASSRA